MKNFKKIILIFFYSLIFFSNAIAIENKILFKVNNEIITSIDILTELKYLGTINNDLNKMPKKQAFEIAKKSLIREKIKEIELKKIFKEIIIEDKFLNNLLVNHFESDEIKSIYDFEKYFLLLDISPNLIKKKISIEVMWNQFIFNKFNQNVKINKEIIKNELLTKDKQNEYLLSEIFFTINENEILDKKTNLLEKEINDKGFSQTALIYSVSNTANKGGKLGWVKETIMSPKIKKIIKQIKINNYTKPIVLPGGFLILKIEDIRETDNDFDLNSEIDKIVIKKTNEQLNQFSNIYFNKIKKNIIINEL
ncbi:peptidylprolyl isomerase [Candidatus Pelagibacter bacterium nBUS_44]|uniref:peptidylprolyl isomerase n=1 Tax=Candidatus Pelagibacter bacterium nBUS_44 TaxID=3374195 RepID=UPI003EBE83CC